MVDLDHDLDRLAMTDDQVATLTRTKREARVEQLVFESGWLLGSGIRKHIDEEDKQVAGIVGLFSGGNDSTVLMHVSRNTITHAGHANTGVGIEATREYVRKVCADWSVPLLERASPRIDDTYRAMVLAHGFPGPGHHYKMFQRLKERALRVIRNELITAAGSPRTHRVVFLAGRRRQESVRRANVPEFERDGSIVWIAPLVNWTKLDMNTYRVMQGDVPINEVANLVHMSGECLCGAFAHKDERTEIEQWFPEAFVEIAELERLIADRTDIPEHAKTWGWGWEWPTIRQQHSKVGRLCSSCEVRAEESRA